MIQVLTRMKYNVEFWLLFSAHYHINLCRLTENAFVEVVRWKWKKCTFIWPATEKDNDFKIYVMPNCVWYGR